MPFRYKFDVMQALKDAGYTSYKLRKEKLLGESVMTQLRAGEMVSYLNLETLCKLLDCQPGDIMEYVPKDGR